MSNTRKSTPVKTKLSLAQLQEKVEKQDEEIKKLQEDALNKNNTIKMMEEKLLRLEGQNISNNSLNFVRDRVTEELQSQLVNLQQYTRRYSVVIAGMRKGVNEKNEVEGILKEAASSTTIEDVDKFHRIGPPKDDKQDLIVRFKSHSAKEDFFICRKNIRRGIKIRPSLAPERRKMLHDATAILEDYNPTDLKNPPEFVYADMHSNLLVQMLSEANRRMFFKFSSIVELCSLIEKHNQEGRVETI